MKIIKHSGHIVDFNRDKLIKSLEKSGAEAFQIKGIMDTIESKLYEGVTTKEIYRIAFSMLKKISNSHAARYNLRNALQLLGPAGFFFEKFIARLFKAEGYSTKTNLTLMGKCVSHEVDVALEKNGIISMIECKFHISRDANSDVKVPMYILSRFNDLKENNHNIFSKRDIISECIIATNNHFTADAKTFASCSELKLLSWDYPDKQSIKLKIDSNCLYPVTCMTSISLAEKEMLMFLDILLVKELANNEQPLLKIGISKGRLKNILKEASQLCNYLQT